IDPHTLSGDHTTSVGIGAISQDGQLLAYEVREGGVDETSIRILDVETRQDLPDQLPEALYSGIVWTPDKTGLYYGRQDRQTGFRIFYHRLGSDPADDQEVFGQGFDPDFWISVDLSDSGRYLLFTVAHGWSRTELFVQDLEQGGPAQPLTGDLVANFFPAFAGDRLIVQTDWQAPTGRILAIDLEQPAPEAWSEIVPARDDAVQGFSLIGGEVFVRSLHNVISRIERFGPDGEPRGEVELPGPGSANTPRGNWESSSAFYSFQSYTEPATIYRYDTTTGTSEVWSRDSVPFDPAPYATRQVWYASKDGTQIPMFVVQRADLEPGVERPTLLYGYGGFNVSLTPRFSDLAALWIESGGVYAVANLRGGGEFGDAWHRAGMLGNKQNVFDDFIAAAEWLIAEGITQPDKLAIQGGSNGGLLVGAALTQRPELYRAVLCQFPDLDMVRYYQFPNNNPPALMEYGDASNPEHFPFLYAYSPYQNVRDDTAYPAVLLTTGDADTRVPPLQARKMTARLQAATASDQPVFLLYDTKAGHAGGRPLSKRIEDLSLEATFLFDQLGL
ncbi:MAG: prolyl oligopeptidase family serine peptidase, partial [Acidobacteriota bacterium]